VHTVGVSFSEAGAVRVLFITSSYPSHLDDPRGIFIHRLARGLCGEGMQVTVIAPGSPSASPHEVQDGVEVERPAYWVCRWQRLATDLSGIVPNLRQHPWLLLQVPPLIAALTRRALRLAPAFDVIHAHWLYPAGIAGVIAARQWKIPLVVTSHGGDLNLARDWWALRFIIRRICQAADACVGVSRSLCEQLVALGALSDRVALIPCGVDLPGAPPPSNDEVITAQQGFKAFEGLRLVYVGSLIPRKSVETLLEAHHELVRRGHSVACAIVGSGPAKDRLQKIVQRRSQRNVVFAGAQAASSIPGWMSAGQVLVLPSLSEGSPSVVMEAMAMGLPVVATDIAGTRELVKEGETGFLFPTRDAERLADCIEQLMGNDGLRKAMGQRARAYIEAGGLTTPQVARKHIALYEQVCTGR
jgi:glycosyltransferase involved in cell wall biosynthesis